ncbi:MAG: hypothetical protein ACRCTG_13350 [Aestuariivirga sp.]
MPALTSTSVRAGGVVSTTENTLTASDTFTWDQNTAGAILILRNGTGGALSPVITGSTASTAIPVAGFGTVSAASLAVGSIPAGQSRVIPLDTRREFLQGTITITGGTGITATLLQY